MKDISELWKDRRKGNDPARNRRQRAVLELWEAWLDEGEGNYEVECITLPEMCNELWRLADQSGAVAPAQDSPNDPKISDAQGLARPPAQAGDVTSPERSLHRMVRRFGAGVISKTDHP